MEECSKSLTGITALFPSPSGRTRIVHAYHIIWQFGVQSFRDCYVMDSSLNSVQESCPSMIKVDFLPLHGPVHHGPPCSSWHGRGMVSDQLPSSPLSAYTIHVPRS